MPEAVTEKTMPPITMTSLKDILIPADRQRQAINDIKLGELATSIQTHGLMNPIVLCPVDVARFPGAKQPFQLVAGYRRLLSPRQAQTISDPCYDEG